MAMDLHIQHAIHNGILIYKGNQDFVREIFYDVSQTLADKYFTKLTEMEVKFDKAFSRHKEKLPLITTKLQEISPNDRKLLGNQGGNNKKTMFVNSQVDINIYSSDYDDIRILERIAKTSMLGFKKSFLGKGYLDIQFAGGTDLAPEFDLTNNEVIIYNRVISYIATTEVIVPNNLAFNANLFDLPWAINPNIIGNDEI